MATEKLYCVSHGERATRCCEKAAVVDLSTIEGLELAACRAADKGWDKQYHMIQGMIKERKRHADD